MFRFDLFKFAFVGTFLLLIGLQELFTQTTHVAVGQTHIFKYNWVPWLFFAIMCCAMVVFAQIAWRELEDRFTALTCLLLIPAYGFLSFQLICERVEVRENMLVHRREPPHTKFNIDIPWDSIETATKIRRQKPGLFRPPYFQIGYELKLDDGATQTLPSNTVLTAAHKLIDKSIADRKIKMETKVIPMPE